MSELEYTFERGQHGPAHDTRANVRTFPEYEQRGEVEASRREAEEQHYLDDCRQRAHEPLQNALNTPYVSSEPTSVAVTHRLETHSNKISEYSLSLAKKQPTPARRVELVVLG
jgi:hypothetical protein